MEVKNKNSVSVKKCKSCGNFYDPHNINFFLNLAISKKISINKNMEVVGILKQTISNQNDFDWCYCYSKEKQLAKTKASNYLQVFEDGYKNFNKIDIGKIGIDFFSNENYLYLKNGSNFSKTDFFSFLKITKNQLEYEEEFSFDFLTYDKMKDDKFLKYYKTYFNYPNFLFIDEIEFLNGKSSQNDTIALKNIIAIIKERVSNGKIIFFSTSLKTKLLKETLYNNFWDGDELSILELINILEDEKVFSSKDIVLQNTKNGLVLSGKKLNIKKTKIVKKKETQIKDERKEELSPIPPDDFEDILD